MVKLTYLYIREFRGIKECSLNFSEEMLFAYREGKMFLQKTASGLSSNFYKVSKKIKSRVVSVNALVGKNGSGKTTIAAFLELFLTSYSDMPQFILVLQDKSEKQNKQSGERISRPNYIVYCNLSDGDKLDVSGDEATYEIRYWKDRYSFPEGRRLDSIFDFIYYSPHYTTERVIGLRYGRAIHARVQKDLPLTETIETVADDIAEPRRYVWDLSQTGMMWDSNKGQSSSSACLWNLATDERIRIYDFLHEVMKRDDGVIESQLVSFLKCP